MQAGGESCLDACAPEADATPPVFTFVPPAVTISSESSPDIGTAVARDDCSAVVVGNDAPATFPVGQTIVHWYAMDASGNSVTASQTVMLPPGVRLSNMVGSAIGFGAFPAGLVNVTANTFLPAGTDLKSSYVVLNALIRDRNGESVHGVPIRLNRVAAFGTIYAKYASPLGSPTIVLTITNSPLGATIALSASLALIDKPASCGTSANVTTTLTIFDAGVAPVRLTRTTPWACIGNGLTLTLSP